MALLTAKEVTEWVPQAASDRSLVVAAIGQAQGLADGHCRRKLETASYDQRYDIEQGQMEIVLRQYPVTAVTSVILDPDGTAEELTSDDYLLDGDAGILTRADTAWSEKFGVDRFWPSGVAQVRVQYTAGYTTTTMEEDLRVALLELVAWRLGWRGGAGAQSESVDGTATTREAMVRGVPESIAGLLERFVRDA